MKLTLPRDYKSSCERGVTLAPGQSIPWGGSLPRVHVNRPLVECKGGSDWKENLLKDACNLYSFGEGSIQSLPKNMIKCDIKYVNQSTETDACSSNAIFASKLDLDILKDELINRILDLRHEMLNANLLSKLSVPDNSSTLLKSTLSVSCESSPCADKTSRVQGFIRPVERNISVTSTSQSTRVYHPIWTGLLTNLKRLGGKGYS